MGTQEAQGNVLSVSLLDFITRRVSQTGERDAAFVDAAPKVEQAIPSHETAFEKISLSPLLSGNGNPRKPLAVLDDPIKPLRHTASANTASLWVSGIVLTVAGLVLFGKALGMLAWNIWSILS